MPYQKKKEGKNYEIISVEGEKNTWQNTTPFHDKNKTLNKIKIKEKKTI